MKVRVDGSVCQGHTLCAMAAADVFELNEEDGHAWVPSDDVPPGREEVVREAARSCPEQAIVLS
ncbi:ferredoxin [Parafrankia sp. FMc2]|uniref:ferredoxin n=1 Tax=Parafrankia sp. FMc2 TaxID=3233196 RepID=UPI0034D428A9